MSLLQSLFSHYPGFGLIIFECILIVLQQQMESRHIGRLRKQYFDKAFFEKHFPQLRDTCRAGYPDVGQGRFADKLSDEQWVAFNNAQRAHQNYLEQLPAVLLLMLIGGLGVPRVAVPMGVLYMVGRHVYGMKYRQEGAAARGAGSRLYYVAVITLLVCALYTSWTVAGGVPGLTNFAKSYTSL